MWVSNGVRRCERCGQPQYNTARACPYDGAALIETGTLCVNARSPEVELSEERYRVAHALLERGCDARTREARTVWNVERRVADDDRGLSRLARVRHPFVPAVLDERATEQFRRYFLGNRFDASLSKAPRVSEGRVVLWMLSALSAAQRMADHGVDCARLAPQSVFVENLHDPFVVLLPAPLRRDGLDKNPVVNEPYLQYLSPESFGQQDERSSAQIEAAAQYAIGAVFFEVLTRRPPFEMAGMATYVEKLQRDAPRVRSLRPEVSEALDAVIARMLARSPDQRYRSLGACAAALIEGCRAELASVEDSEDQRPLSARIARPDLRRFARVEHASSASVSDEPAALWERLFSRGLLDERWLDGGARLFAQGRCGECVVSDRGERCERCNGARWTNWNAAPSHPLDAVLFASCASDVEAAEDCARSFARAWGLDASAVTAPIRWEPVTSEHAPPFARWVLGLTSDSSLYVRPMDATALSVAPMWWQRVASVAEARVREFDRWVELGANVGVSDFYPASIVGEGARASIAKNPWRFALSIARLGFVFCSASADAIVLGYRSTALRSLREA